MLKCHWLVKYVYHGIGLLGNGENKYIQWVKNNTLSLYFSIIWKIFIYIDIVHWKIEFKPYYTEYKGKNNTLGNYVNSTKDMQAIMLYKYIQLIKLVREKNNTIQNRREKEIHKQLAVLGKHMATKQRCLGLLQQSGRHTLPSLCW